MNFGLNFYIDSVKHIFAVLLELLNSIENHQNGLNLSDKKTLKLNHVLSPTDITPLEDPY